MESKMAVVRQFEELGDADEFFQALHAASADSDQLATEYP